MEPLIQLQQEQMVQNEAVRATFLLAAAAAAAFGKRNGGKGAYVMLSTQNPIRGNLFQSTGIMR